MGALQLGKITAKAYLYNQGGTVSLFLFTLACHILNLANKHAITLIPAYVPTHLSVKADYLLQGKLIPNWHLLLHIAQAALQHCSQIEVDLLASSRTNQCQLYYTLERPLPPGALGLNALKYPWKFQLCYVFYPTALIPLVLSMFLVEHATCQCRLLILMVPCWKEDPWLSTVLNMLKDIPHQWRSHQRSLNSLGAQRSAIAAFSSLSAQRHMLHRQRYSSLGCQAVTGETQSFYNKCLPAVLERMGRLVCYFIP